MRKLTPFAIALLIFASAGPAASAHFRRFTVKAGETLTTVFTNVNKSCEPAVGPFRITVPPRYGSLSFRLGSGQQMSNPNPACNFRRFPAIVVVYTAPRRFVGQDRVSFMAGTLSATYVLDIVP